MARSRRVVVLAAVAVLVAASVAVFARTRPESATAELPVPGVAMPRFPDQGAWTIDGAIADTTAYQVPAPGGDNRFGFDACETPTLTQMRTWRQHSPYRTIGIYIGGVLRHCANAALKSPAWVTSVVIQGWHVMPIYVGPQAPCTGFRVTIDASKATADGTAAAKDAVARARDAGIPPGAPIYVDLEGWREVDPACDRAVRQYLTGWVGTLHEAGYLAGMYSPPWAGIRVAYEGLSDPTFRNVDAVWIAAWNGVPDLLGAAKDVPASLWAGGRAQQYRGDHDETWGGITINIDNNLIGGPVYPALR